MKENDTIKETIKLKSLFQQDETNIVGGLKSLDSCKYSKAKICKGQEKQNTLSISFDNSNNTSNNNYINRPSLHNSIEIKTFEQKQDDETEDSINLIKNKQNGMEFKIKIKEYEDCIRLLEFKEKKAKAQMKEQERSHNEKYHQLSQIYNEIKNQYETVCEESVKIEEV